MATAKKPQPKPSNTIQIVAKDFRQTSAISGLAKKLFDPNEQLKLSPQLITSIFKAAGMNVPPGVQISADVAQIVISGGAVINAVEHSANIRSIMIPSTLVLRSVTDLLQVAGLMPKDSPAAQILDFGTNVALVVASGGLNVLADLALVLNIIGQFFSGIPDRTKEYTDYARAMANQNAVKWFYERETGQAKAAALTFQDYQLGKLSSFQMLGKVAESAPDLFLNYFPELGYFLPPTIAQKCISYRFQKTDRGGPFGLSSKDYDITESKCINYQTILYRKNELQSAFVNEYILKPYFPYQKIDTMRKEELSKYGYPDGSSLNGIKPHRNPVSRIRMQDLAVLSLFPPYFQFVRGDFDIAPIMRSLQITPADLGYSVFNDELSNGDFSTKPPSFGRTTFNGVNYLDVVKEYGKPSSQDQALISYDERGMISSLLRDEKAGKILREWGLIPYLDKDTLDFMHTQAYPKRKILQTNLAALDERRTSYRSNQEEAINYGAPTPDEISQHEDETGYRNVRNYWSVLQMAQAVSQDPYFMDYDVQAQLKGLVPMLSSLEVRHKQIQWLSAARKMNQLAVSKIASYYNVPTNRLRVLKPEPGKLARVQIV